MRIAVVTPYCDESRSIVERCIASVQAQSMPVDQVLVADGNPQDWLEAHANVTHVVLQKRTADFGDTPRSIGFVVAMRSGYDVVQFLDADNLLMPDHFDVTLRHFRGRGAAEYPDVVVARRIMLRTDGSVLDVSVPEEDAITQIDTNCYAFYRTAFDVGLKWSLIPRQLSFMGDRVFFAMLTQLHSDLRLAFNPTKTIGYTCLWETIYRMAGETPPANCKNLEALVVAAGKWWHALDPHSKHVIERALGLPISFPV